MEKPIRVQRKRTKGFKLPPNTKCVNRGTRFGNPFKVWKSSEGLWLVETTITEYQYIVDKICAMYYFDKLSATQAAVQCHKYLVNSSMLIRNDIAVSLQGLNLACFCPLDSPCHADILLEIANG